MLADCVVCENLLPVCCLRRIVAMLLELPDELLSNLLSTWMTMVEVAHLDSAFCSRESRRSFLQAAYNARVILMYPPVLSHWGCVRNALCEWMLKRDAVVSGFYVTKVFNDSHQARQDYLRRHGVEIRWVNFNSSSGCLQLSSMDIADYCPKLIIFRAEGSTCMPNFLQIASKCPLIEDLSINSHFITPAVVEALSSRPNQLRSLSLEVHEQEDEPALCALVSNSPLLQSVDVEGVVTAAFFGALTRSCPQLETLLLCRVCVDGAVRDAIVRYSKSLSRVNFDDCHFPDEPDVPTPAAPVCESMRYITVEDSDIDAEQLDLLLRSCPGLTCLDIANCDEHELRDMSSIPLGELCPALRVLSVHDCGAIVDYYLLENISEHCPELRALQIPDCWEIHDCAVCSIAERCPHLTQLVLEECGSNFTDESLRAIAKYCKELTALSLIGCKRITDKGVAAVMAGCPALNEFLVWHDSRKLSRGMIETVRARYADGDGFFIQDVL